MPTVLVPNLFFSTGQGAVVPVIPIVASQVGGSVAAGAFAGAMLMVGQLSGALPAGWLVGRAGERVTMLVAAALSSVGAVCAGLAGDLAVMCVGVFFLGLAGAIFTMARHSWMTVAIPVTSRGRALSFVAGMNRFGTFVGPLLGALVIAATQQTSATFALVVVAAAGVWLVLTVWGGADPAPSGSASAEAEAITSGGVWRTMRQQRGVLVRVGFGASALGAARASRQVIIPLWGLRLGIDDVQIALIVGAGAALDFALFYLGGHLMDRLGRLAVALPALGGFAAAHVLLALSSVLPGEVAWFLALVGVMAIANGISSGVVATLGSDLADPRRPSDFLSSWRLVTDVGPAGAPLIISVTTAVASLAAASLSMGLLALVGAWALARFTPAAVRGAPAQPM